MKRVNFWMIVLVMIAFLFAACEQKETSIKGVVTDASMNTLTVAVASGDTLTFSTLNAERTAADGVLLGDTATVYYAGRLKQTTSASRIVVTPAQAEPTLEGEWTQPVNGMPGKVQGMLLAADGKASSIDMATLLYESWSREADRLILSGKSLGNGQTISFSDTLRIDRLTADSLILSAGEAVWRYARKQ